MTVHQLQRPFDEVVAYFNEYVWNDSSYDKCCLYLQRCSNETLVEVWNYSWPKILALEVAARTGAPEYDDNKADVWVTVPGCCECILAERGVRLKMGVE